MHKGKSYFGVAALVLIIVIVAVFAGRESLFKGSLRGAACGSGDIICLKEQIEKTQRQYDNARKRVEQLEKLAKRYEDEVVKHKRESEAAENQAEKDRHFALYDKSNKALISAREKLDSAREVAQALGERLKKFQTQLEKEKLSPSRATCKKYAKWRREETLTRSHRDVYEVETLDKCAQLYHSDFFPEAAVPSGFGPAPAAPSRREGTLGNPCISSDPGRGYCVNFAKCDQEKNLCVAPQKFDQALCDQFSAWAREGKLTRNVPDLNRQAEVMHSCDFYRMQEREAAAPAPTFGPAPSPEPGFGPPPVVAPTPPPGFVPLPAGSVSFSVSVNGYPDAPSQVLANVHVNVYTVTPVRSGIYEGKLRETLKTGNNGEAAKTVIKPGEIVDFVGFQDFEKAKNVRYWTFSAPPYKNFDGSICQTNFLDTNSKMSDSCTTGIGTPAQDRSGSSIVLVPKVNAEKSYSNFEVWVQESNDPSTTVREGAKVRLYEPGIELGTKKQIGEGITDHRGAVTFIIETGRKFVYDAQLGPDKHYGVDNVFYITDDGKHIRNSISQDETAVMRLGAYRKESKPSHPAPVPAPQPQPDIEQDMDIVPLPLPAIELPKISLDIFPLLPTSSAPKEDCVAFKPLNLLITNLGRGSFSLEDNGHLIANFPDESEAKRARRIIQQFRLGEICFSGRGTESKPMTYWLTEGSHKAPSGSLPKTDGAEDCLSFNPKNLTVKQEATDRYFVMNGNSSMMMTSSRSAALERIQILQKYGMNQTCYVGRPDPSMTYFKAP